ncbi:MAG TPA: SMC-Scp complex subunit ScpB [Gammaproteobacteria bacterium]|nr:SMC-Scp complex subunit ScpB [Gammaproteobacteria bacterium]
MDNKLKMVVEGLLLAAGRPLTIDNIASVFDKKERPDRQELKAVMQVISEECNDRGFELTEVASGYRFQVKQELSEWIGRLWEEKSPRYTRALLETLSLIVYRQPITRGDIEEIRGVGVSPNIIRTLLDREWVRVVGHRDVPGRPAMFATTKQFLDYFNLKSLQELPPLAEIKDLGKSEQELDLEDDFTARVSLELPEEAIDESSYERTVATEAELLAEREAVELSKKPLDEILGINLTEELLDSEDSIETQRSESAKISPESASEPSRTPMDGKQGDPSIESGHEKQPDQGDAIEEHDNNIEQSELDAANETMDFEIEEERSKFD